MLEHVYASTETAHTMPDSTVFGHEELATEDLVVDAIYEGGEANNLSAAPLPDLMGVGTNGGFRPKRSLTPSMTQIGQIISIHKLCSRVLYTYLI